jgi:hypothetical protein
MYLLSLFEQIMNELSPQDRILVEEQIDPEYKK